MQNLAHFGIPSYYNSEPEGRVKALGSLSHANESVAIIGVSPFSGFFTTSNVQEIIEWTRAHFLDFRIFIPDEPTVYSLIAFGYDEEKAAKKAKRQCNYLYNKCITALQNCNRKFGEEKILAYQGLLKNNIFQENLNYVLNAYESDQNFKHFIDSFSTEFMQSKSGSLSKKCILNSSLYLLHEIPLFIASNEVVQANQTIFIYPKIPDVIKSIMNGISPLNIKNKMPYVEYKMENRHGDD
ncbi:tRNA-dependent cyclodipeptide synthase [Alteromonas sp. ASW11-130]|uniref:tRNA-dependent cyclodipeptide synthase n=1 Tax=Alteromonas sp. ASW11-130 TaxID=3015775 RepID=UPI0022418AA3|nr:tRNA-dependent cyclodipeptide synthase [Alteromonas sp. ASW11-130]MCW8093389.1 tRNA-dependent cyclodipeptide synthase [Alteromonas sp. ASW11-130]